MSHVGIPLILRLRRCGPARDVRNEAAERINALSQALTETTTALAEWIEDHGGCDHDAGICICSDIGVLHRARVTLKEAV